MILFNTSATAFHPKARCYDWRADRLEDGGVQLFSQSGKKKKKVFKNCDKSSNFAI